MLLHIVDVEKAFQYKRNIMPIYDFLDKKDNVEFEAFFSIKEKEEFLSEHPHIQQLPPTQINIVSGVTFKNDDGWNENLQRIAEANPNTALADKVAGRTSKEKRTAEAVDKWRKKKNMNP